MIGSGPTASETLKNLVLPGLGSFTLLDNAVVGSADLGNNFFVTADSVGKPRAEVVTELLTEMNPDDCTGSFRVADPAQVIATEPDYFDQFTMVVATQMAQVPLLALAKVCEEKGLPLAVVRSYGFLGYLRLALTKPHEIIESKPDTELYDLRMASPFPSLHEHCTSFDLDGMEDMDHAHTPYVIILIHAVQRWRDTHDGNLPKGFGEKNDFKELVKSMARSQKESEINFEEALANAFRAYTEPAVDEDLVAIVDQARVSTLSNTSTEFEILCSALASFMDNEGGGLPPLTGSIPDMHSDNPKYIALQKVYLTKAAQDLAVMQGRVEALLEGLGLPKDYVSAEKVELFCRQAWSIKVLKTRSIEEEYASAKIDPDLLWDMTQEELIPQSPLLWYVGLRGVDRFQTARGYFPGAQGTDDETLASEAAAVWQEMQGLCSELSVELSQLNEGYAKEMVRVGGAELHNIAAVIGGVASQEITKVLTHQWVPANNTFIFNGIGGTAQTIEF